jgi:hypothetical protein
MSTSQSSAEDQIHLARCFATRVQEGHPYSEATFWSCYRESLPITATEDPANSELWSKSLWAQLREVPVEQFVIAAKHPSALEKLVYRVWGKAF